MSTFYLVIADDDASGRTPAYRSEKGHLHARGVHDNGTGYLLSHYVYLERPDEKEPCILLLPIGSHLPDDGKLWYFDPYDHAQQQPLLRTGPDDPSEGKESDELDGYWIHIDLTKEFTNNPFSP